MKWVLTALKRSELSTHRTQHHIDEIAGMGKRGEAMGQAKMGAMGGLFGFSLALAKGFFSTASLPAVIAEAERAVRMRHGGQWRAVRPGVSANVNASASAVASVVCGGGGRRGGGSAYIESCRQRVHTAHGTRHTDRVVIVPFLTECSPRGILIAHKQSTRTHSS
jgi:hypothetical protein